MEDDEHARLHAEFDQAAQEYSQAVRDLRDCSGTLSIEVYRSLIEAADVALIKCEQARRALEQYPGHCSKCNSR